MSEMKQYQDQSPEEWEVKTFEDVLEIRSGRNQKEVINPKGQYPILGSAGKIMGYTDEFLCNEGTTIIGRKGTIDNPLYIKTKFWNVDTAFGLVARENLDKRYLYYFCLSFDFKDLDKGTTLPSLVKKDLIKISIPLPPLPEQKRIVSILDKAFSEIEKAKSNARQNLKNAKELFESYLQGVFENRDEGWEEISLGEIANFRNGMNFTKSSKGEVIKIAGVKNFKEKFWIPFVELESVTINGKLNDIDLLKEGDIIAVRSNGNPELIGRTLLSGKVNSKVSHSGFTIRIRLKLKNISSIYLCHYLKTQKTRKELVESGNGVGIKSLNQGFLSALVIPYPKSIKQQQVIVRKIDDLATEIKT